MAQPTDLKTNPLLVKNPRAASLRIIGSRPQRADGPDKLTGRACYGADTVLPGLVQGKVLRSPHAHARILSIDTRKAEALPGVYAVIAAEDLPEAEPGNHWAKFVRDNTLASDKVLYVGHPIAAVAAQTPHLAEQALELIAVEYEVLPPVLDVMEALRDDAPLLHETFRLRTLAGPATKTTNLADHFQYLTGDPAQGFAEADVVVEREFRTATVHQGYIEPQAATAEWSMAGPGSDGGDLTVYTTTQGAFAARDHLADVLRLPFSRIRVIPTEVGGAFGGKNSNVVAVVAALLSRKAGRPVKVAMSRTETFLATGPSAGTVIRVKAGARRDGKLTAVQAGLYFEIGAYPVYPTAGMAAQVLTGPYLIPNAQVDGYEVLVNKPATASYRAPGATQANFAMESVINELAEKLGLDPLDFRLFNSVREGDRQVDGSRHGNIGAVEVLQAAEAHPHYRAPLEHAPSPGIYRGRGVAHAYWSNWGARSSCTLNVNTDGTVALLTGSVDLSGTRTTLAMQAAEALEIPLERIHPTVGDTATTGYTDVSAGSRTTFTTGMATIQAAQSVLAQLRERAALLWNVPVETVSYAQGAFATAQPLPDGLGCMTFNELAAQLPNTGGAVTGVANVDAHERGASFATHIADVEVDAETGRVTLLRYTAVQDVGKAVHPTYVEGQMQGGAVQGIGWALYEGYAYDDQGRMLNPNFLDYKIPTALDVPMIDTVLVEVPYPGHPFGVRGVGEAPIIPPPAAIAAAIYRAIGVRPAQLPMTPASLLKKLEG
ncbi:MAG: xanthine dehydrogenase family protein molybdopterin-binding subunit [Anaerolineae bacterium]|nr:xanthine dehydrogenase family protein molybdopterin-binding subunit [Anaerolineae bacterium]